MNVSCVSRTLIMWFNFLYLHLGLLPIWPDWDNVEQSMPECIKSAYPTTFAIIDATELKCETPSSLSLQFQHYSSYKSHTTMKSLVAVAPNGAFVFITEFFTGISDRKLFIESGILELLKTVPASKASWQIKVLRYRTCWYH